MLTGWTTASTQHTQLVINLSSEQVAQFGTDGFLALDAFADAECLGCPVER
jgi:hypothetical protein